jgi:hypothetical protein
MIWASIGKRRSLGTASILPWWPHSGHLRRRRCREKSISMRSSTTCFAGPCDKLPLRAARAARGARCPSSRWSVWQVRRLGRSWTARSLPEPSASNPIFLSSDLKDLAKGVSSRYRIPDRRKWLLGGVNDLEAIWCENSVRDSPIFMASGWPGQAHGSLLPDLERRSGGVWDYSLGRKSIAWIT